MPAPYNIILIDDNVQYSSSLVLRGSQINFNISPFTNLADAMVALRDDSSVNGVILDAHCLIAEGKDAEMTFLAEAHSQLSALINAQDRRIFTIVNTAYADDVTKFFGGSYEIIQKAGDHALLFMKLQEGINNLDTTFIRGKYSKEIEAIYGLFPKSNKAEELVTLVANMNREDAVAIKTNLNQIRVCYESLQSKLCEGIQIPQGFKPRDVINYLRGWTRTDSNGQDHTLPAPAIPEYIAHICTSLYGLGSYGSHNNDDAIPVSKYTVIGSVNHLLELISWLGKKNESLEQ